MPPVFSDINHPLRLALAAEVHARPFLRLDAPELISHLAVYGAGDGAQHADAAAQRATLAELCGHFGVAAPAAGSNYFHHDFGLFRLKWEGHTEFSTFTFTQAPGESLATADAFARMPARHIPPAWLASLRGKVLVAAHVALERGDGPAAPFAAGLQRVFEGNLLVGSQVLQGGELWTDFAIQSDGFSRFVVRDVDMRAQQAGRLVQRVLEIETYRTMALLALPQASRAAPALNAIESELAGLATAMVDTDDAAAGARAAPDADTEQALLGRITRLAARIEKLSLENSFRFAASQAYFKLVRARIGELREVRIEGLPTVEEFMERRLTPAMNTCQAVAGRQEALAQRIANTNDLLRTRVGIVQERQNRRILQSMNARAAQQLRLQQAVEGLSVVAISYYLIGLIGYAGKAAKAFGLIGDPEAGAGLLVPFVAGGAWLVLRNMHKRMGQAAG